MPLVLALEPDLRQAGIIKKVIREQVQAELVLVDSRDAAIAALNNGVPDVVLLTALLSPRDEEELITHLRALPGAEHLQTHTLPQLACGAADAGEAKQGGLLGKFRRKKEATAMAGCDPSVFAEEVRAYLQRAAELKVEAASQPAPLTAAIATARHARGTEVQSREQQEDPAAGPPVDSWSSPFEWRRSPAQDMRSDVVADLPAIEASQGDADYEPERLRLEAEEALERERQRVEAEAKAERERLRAEAEAEAAAAAERERQRLEAEAAAERQRLEAEAAAERERMRLEAEAAAERERQRLAAEAAAERERLRVEAEAAAERERRRLEAEAAAERERIRREAEAAAERERQRLAAEAKAERERLRAEAEAAARRERERLEAEAAAERERLRIEVEAAAERERQRLEAEAAAERERLMAEAAAAAERERVRIEEELAAERERIRAEAEAAAELERFRLEMELAAEREIAARAAAAKAEPPPDPFAEFRLDDEEEHGIFKLMPISSWARRIEVKRPADAEPQPGDELRNLMSGLLLPPPVASITYPRGCRIRRVRVPPAAVVAAERDKRPVIVSRRALNDARR